MWWLSIIVINLNFVLLLSVWQLILYDILYLLFAHHQYQLHLEQLLMHQCLLMLWSETPNNCNTCWSERSVHARNRKTKKNNSKTTKHHTKQQKLTNFDQYIQSKQRDLKIARARYVIHTWYACIFSCNLHHSIHTFSAKCTILHTTQKRQNFAKLHQKQ